jgi:hypothetical protein
MSEDTKYHEQDEPPNIRGFSAFDLDRLEAELTTVTEQRDSLAEALERVLEYQGRFDEEDPESIAAEALAAVKGGGDD